MAKGTSPSRHDVMRHALTAAEQTFPKDENSDNPADITWPDKNNCNSRGKYSLRQEQQ